VTEKLLSQVLNTGAGEMGRWTESGKFCLKWSFQKEEVCWDRSKVPAEKEFRQPWGLGQGTERSVWTMDDFENSKSQRMRKCEGTKRQ
jgi:hypothetical protein